MKTLIAVLASLLCLAAAGRDVRPMWPARPAPQAADSLQVVIEQLGADGRTAATLKTDAAGAFLIDHGDPFTVRVRARLASPSQRVLLKADRDLGEPDRAPVKAGEDLGFLCDVKRSGDLHELSLEFDARSDLMPAPGLIAFSAVITDPTSSLIGQAKSAVLRIQDITSLRAHVLPLFVIFCWNCHSATTKFEGLELTLTGVFTTAVNVRAHETPMGSCAELRLEPFDPDASYLVHKIQGTHLGGCVQGGGERMPAGGPFLSNAQIDIIRRWISQGCRNN